VILTPDITLSFSYWGTIGGGAIGDSVVQTHSGNVIHMSDNANLGVMDNAEISLDGDLDQRVETGSGIGAALVRFAAGIDAAGYQWYRDGVALPGATGSDLDFAGVYADDYSVYHCEGNGGEVARRVIVDKWADSKDRHAPRAGFLRGKALQLK